MAYAFITQYDDDAPGGFSGSSTTIASSSRTFTLNDLVLVQVSYLNASVLSTTVSDGASTFTEIGSGTRDANGTVTHWFYAYAVTAGTRTLTATFASAATFRAMTISRYSGIQSASDPLVGSVLGAAQNGPGGGTDDITSGSASPSSQPCMALAATTNGGGTDVATSAGTGFGNLQTLTKANAGLSHNTEDQGRTDTSSISGTFTSTTGGGSTWVTMLAFFKEEGAGGSPDPLIGRRIYVMP